MVKANEMYGQTFTEADTNSRFKVRKAPTIYIIIPNISFLNYIYVMTDRLCGLEVRVPGC
jgi:hypothetical protein